MLLVDSAEDALRQVAEIPARDSQLEDVVRSLKPQPGENFIARNEVADDVQIQNRQ